MLFFLVPVLLIGIGFALRYSVKSFGLSTAVWAGLMFFAALGLGSWAILQSRSSTAGIGFLFLPFLSIVPALGGLIIGIGQKKRSNGLTLGGAVIVLLSCSFYIKTGLDSRALNDQRDAQYKAQLERQRQIALELKKLFSDNVGKEDSALFQYYEAHKPERAVALELLKTPFVSNELLEILAQSKDLGVVLSVVRNPNVTGKMLENIYDRAQYKDYYHADLARNPKSSTKLLVQVAKGHNTSLPQALMANPNCSCEVLVALSETIRTGYLSDEKKSSWKAAIEERKKTLCR